MKFAIYFPLLSTNNLGPTLGQDLAKVKLAVGALLHGTLLCYDRVDELGGRHVKGRVPDADPLVGRRDSDLGALINGAIRPDDGACNLGEFLLLALLDLDAVSGFRLEVEAGCGGCHDELDAVVLGQDGQLVGADLVGGVSVADHTVGADDDGGDVGLVLLGAEQGGGHRVGDERAGDTLVHELKGCQSASLVVRSGLGAVGVAEKAT